MTICEANMQREQTSLDSGLMTKKNDLRLLDLQNETKMYFQKNFEPIAFFLQHGHDYYVSLPFSNQVLLGPKNIMIEFLVDAKT